ncbi:MAG TPA: cbb3-type cytochrome c oxidase subunit I [Acidimicrobiales bacterium]|nr:cbb3-type cytochrome c oxidase subunit I [Acidimicrobiales bacterium]
MTLLDDRPTPEPQPEPPAEQRTQQAAAPSEPVHRPTLETWLDTTDHKRLGLLFVYAALVFVIGGGVVGLIIGAKQVSPGLNLAADRWVRLYGLHTQMTVLLFLTAMWIGLATYVVPLQIGAGRLAVPRLLATGFWTYLVGGCCFVASYIVGQVNGAGITQPTPIAPIPGGANTATTLWVVSLALIALGFLLASASLVTTIVALRTEGMTFMRVPAFSWATLVASAITLVATPVFLAGLLLLGLDQHFGGSLFDPKTPGNLPIWQHTIWLYGRPDVFLLTLFALGAATDIVSTHARRPLLDHRAVLVLLGVFGGLSLATFVANDSATRAVIVPTYSFFTAAVAAPLGLIVLLWLGTVAKGQPRFNISLVYVVGAILLWVSGAANAIGAAAKQVKGLNGGSTWVAGNVHTVVAGVPTLLAVGAIYHWAPKIWGRKLNTGLGGLAFLALFGGFLASGLGYYFLGYNGAPLGQISGFSSYQKTLYGVAEAGGVLVVLGIVVLLIDLGISVVAGRCAKAGDDPYEGLTLEWATSSPPPPWGFETVPEVRSEAPLLHLRPERRTGGADSPDTLSNQPALAGADRG